MIELSVIIPTYNRAGRLRSCLEALTHQTQPAADFEVIVVIDGSTDETSEMLAQLATPFTLTALHQANSGQNIACNNGAAHARGRYCLFLDDDIVAEPQLVAEHLRLHRKHKKVAGIGQITLNVVKPDWFMQRFAEGWHEHYQQLNLALRQPFWADGYGGNISVSRAMFMEVGGFAPDIRRSGDIELAYRLEQHGLRFIYLSSAIGHQDERKGYREFFADAAESGAAWVAICRRHPSMLPELLGRLGKTRAGEALLRKLFWRCGLSPWFLARSGSFLARTSWGSSWYRFLFAYGYWWGARRAIPDGETWERMVRGVPILMYHAFAGPGEPPSRFVLPVKRFARQMAWLKRLNYRVISLEEFLQYRRQLQLPPHRSVIITIDDGYAEIATHVHPILCRYNFPATVFLVSRRIGGCYDWQNHEALNGRRLLSWTEIREIASQGIRFGAHTRTHPVLTGISVEDARAEIAGSKADLESALQMPITTFAYPYGEFDEPVQDLVERTGFSGGCSADSGFNNWAIPLTALRRIEIEGTWSLLRFLLALHLGEDACKIGIKKPAYSGE
ncbi:MAG: glycosyltransferase [Calditrichaceae bacterium]|nr:glycosyltransferase [Calditrichia bacterium]NUQ40597.1 glycosyltransferase [Calditrichaceae bacterium]